MSIVIRGNILSVRRVYFWSIIMYKIDYPMKLVKIENVNRFLNGLEKDMDIYP